MKIALFTLGMAAYFMGLVWVAITIADRTPVL